MLPANNMNGQEVETQFNPYLVLAIGVQYDLTTFAPSTNAVYERPKEPARSSTAPKDEGCGEECVEL